MEQLPYYLTVEEAAKVLRVSRSEMYVLVKNGTVKHAKIGRLIRVLRDSLLNIQQDTEDASA